MTVSKNQNQNAGFHFFSVRAEDNETRNLKIRLHTQLHSVWKCGKEILFSDEKADRIIYEMIRIGNNISQIAHFVNMEHTFEPKDFERI